jgi:hypothetical protein
MSLHLLLIRRLNIATLRNEGGLARTWGFVLLRCVVAVPQP